MKLQALIVIICLLTVAPVAHTEPLSRGKVPKPLRPWTDWVLWGHRDQLCPMVQNGADAHRCLWPSRLILAVGETAARFSQDFRVYRQTFVMLPGDRTRWPLDVRVDGKPAPVIRHNGIPAVYLEAGRHTVEGSFTWDHMPQILPVPAETGLISLTVDGKPVDFPNRELTGQLWLRSAAVPAAPEGLEVEVQRRVVDEVPLLLVTRIELDVSGKDREATLGKALPDGFVPMLLQSPLPARVEPDGRLRVQLRPGTWTLDLTARHEGPCNSLSMPATDPPWPAQEVWAFEAHNDLRVVLVEGVRAVDPSQTRLLPQWRRFPAFLMQPGKVMHLVEKRRGDADPAPDQLNLERTLWLDFSGHGYTVRDSVFGTMSKSWRLEMTPRQQLGRVAIGGVEQVITRRNGVPLSGVEIRQGQLQMRAVSRINSPITRLPAVGWDHDFQSVSTTLNLPPGWRLFRASGVDDVSRSWITDWTVLEIFLVLITATVVYRMWGPAWGLAALLTLALTYPEFGAPKWIWLALLAGEAFELILPKGRGRWVIQAYRLAAAAAFVLIAAPFMVDQIRTAIYPALEFQRTLNFPENLLKAKEEAAQAFGVGRAAPAGRFTERWLRPQLMHREAAVGQAITPMAASRGIAGALAGGEYRAARPPSPAAYSYAAIDPNAIITTGPGVPRWRWHSMVLTWRGPVQRGQQIHLWLLSPFVNFLLGFCRAGLIALLAFRVLISMRPTSRSLPRSAATVAAVLALFILAPSLAPQARAEFPSDRLLYELQRRLLENPDCAPRCASIPRMRIEVRPSALVARIEIDAAANVAVPLPESANGFRPARVTLDGKNAQAIARTQDGFLWLLVPPGKHQALMEGPLPQVDSLEIPLPLRPHRLKVFAAGWSVEGIHDNGVPENVIRLVRQLSPGAKRNALQPGELPPFVSVTRLIHLGLEWEVDTMVERVTASGSAITLQVPLLSGESVTTPGMHVENGKVVVSMAASMQAVQWHSTLEVAPSIALKAPNSVPWTEIWRLNAEPMWHVELSGIPEIYRAPEEGVDRVREWRPWPGEAVLVAVTRPKGIAGPTLTIDSSRLKMNPGPHAADVALTLEARSSRGGQKSFVLPARAQLQSVTINGAVQPIRQEKETVIVPIVPGRQTIEISWREPRGIGLRVATPGIKLDAPSVNADTIINMPTDRWTLFVAPAILGPAVLFWALLLVFALAAILLGRSGLTPLRGRHWFLLSLGLTQAPVWWAAVVAGWLLALGWRKPHGASIARVAFWALQVLLAVLTLVALAGLFASIKAGLLGLPQMYISGNGSSAAHLQWFHDRTATVLPRMWVVSVPLIVYRLAMLLWALWLASALLSWLRWGWGCFSAGGLWRSAGGGQASPLPVADT